MIKGTVVVMAVVVFCGLLACAPSGPNMKEGLWEVTTKMDLSGYPMQMPAQTNTICLTKKDAVPQRTEPGEDCKMIKREVKGDTVSWVMECRTPEGTAVIDGSVTYKGDTFKGSMKMKERGTMVTWSMQGRWIGKCEK